MPDGEIKPTDPPAPPPLVAGKKRRPGGGALDIYRAVGDGKIDRRATDTRHARAIRGLRAVMPEVGEALIDKALRGRKSKGDTKALIYLAQAGGLGQKHAAITEEERKRIAAESDELDAADVNDLQRLVYTEAGLIPKSDLRVPGIEYPS